MKKRVRVYKNLHRNCWSIQEYIRGRGWRLWDYLCELVVDNPKFIVYEKGRQRVISTRKKNVHAFIIGEIDIKRHDPWYGQKLNKTPPKFRPNYHQKIQYNPYVDEFFHINGIRPNPELTEVYLDIEHGVYI